MILKKRILVIVFFALLGCSKGKSVGLTGTFEVIGNVSFPLSALSDQETSAYTGKQVIIGEREAIYNGDTCTISKIDRDTMPTEEYLGQIQGEIEKKIQTKLPPEIIGMSIYCKERFWEGFPNHFININTSTVLSVSEGVVFILKRK